MPGYDLIIDGKTYTINSDQALNDSDLQAAAAAATQPATAPVRPKKRATNAPPAPSAAEQERFLAQQESDGQQRIEAYVLSQERQSAGTRTENKEQSYGQGTDAATKAAARAENEASQVSAGNRSRPQSEYNTGEPGALGPYSLQDPGTLGPRGAASRSAEPPERFNPRDDLAGTKAEGVLDPDYFRYYRQALEGTGESGTYVRAEEAFEGAAQERVRRTFSQATLDTPIAFSDEIPDGMVGIVLPFEYSDSGYVIHINSRLHMDPEQLAHTTAKEMVHVERYLHGRDFDYSVPIAEALAKAPDLKDRNGKPLFSGSTHLVLPDGTQEFYANSYHSTIAEGLTPELYLDDVLAKDGIPQKIFSDHNLPYHITTDEVVTRAYERAEKHRPDYLQQVLQGTHEDLLQEYADDTGRVQQDYEGTGAPLRRPDHIRGDLIRETGRHLDQRLRQARDDPQAFLQRFGPGNHGHVETAGPNGRLIRLRVPTTKLTPTPPSARPGQANQVPIPTQKTTAQRSRSTGG